MQNKVVIPLVPKLKHLMLLIMYHFDNNLHNLQSWTKYIGTTIRKSVLFWYPQAM